MDTSRTTKLGELAGDAALERKDFLVRAAEQLDRFLEANSDRILDLGGLTLIDDDPDYLAIAPDLTFRSRSRFQDPTSGEWTSETEVIESAAELVELYNPADIYAAFAEGAREAAGMAAEPTATQDLLETAHVGLADTVAPDGADPYAAAADDWAAGQPVTLDADDEDTAARQLYDLALEYQERSQLNESRIVEQFENAARNLTARIGDLVVIEDDDEKLTLEAGGGFRAEVLPEDAAGAWRTLGSAEDLVEFYDPTDIFGDLADALADAYPSVAPDEAGEGDEADEGDEGGEEPPGEEHPGEAIAGREGDAKVVTEDADRAEGNDRA